MIPNLEFLPADGYQAPLQQTGTVIGGEENHITFTYVSNANTAPTIAALADQSIPLNGATAALSCAIGDAETAAADLTLTAESSNPALVPVAGIVFGGSGANRTLTATPTANRLGSATITVTVSDGMLSSSTAFVLTVTGTALETWCHEHFGSPANDGPGADGADPDGHGRRNLDEFAAGTGPNNATDFFRILTATKTASAYTLTADGKAGRSYVMERSTAPGTDAWVSVGTVGPLVAPGPVELTDPAPPPNAGFYRLRVTGPR
jgi:hypothetical protein